MTTVTKWQEFVRQILVMAANGYVEYVYVDIPESKRHRLSVVVRKLLRTYPEAKFSSAKRYRRKKRGKANVAMIRWDRRIVIMRTLGEWSPRPNEDRFRRLSAQPHLLIAVGQRIRIRVGPAKAGKEFTAFLDRESYRWLRDTILECLRVGQLEAAATLWRRTRKLPAFSGVAEQLRHLREYLQEECRRQQIPHVFPPLKLAAVY